MATRSNAIKCSWPSPIPVVGRRLAQASTSVGRCFARNAPFPSVRVAAPSVKARIRVDERRHEGIAAARQNQLLETLSVRTAMTEAADLLAPVLGADKVDCAFYDPSIDSLVALGSSNTAMGRRQQEIGMDRLPLANGGPAGRMRILSYCRASPTDWGFGRS